MSANKTIEKEISHLLNENQNPGLVKKICVSVKDILTSEEQIEYVAVQKRLNVNPTPNAIVLTNRRFISYRPKLLGRVSFSDHTWRDLSSVHLHEGVVGATLTFKTVDGGELAMGYLPKVQARRVYALAQEKQEKVREDQRRRELEDKRAAAGGIVMNSPQGDAQQHDGSVDPTTRLRKLKAMLDAGLISTREFEAKKAEIMAKV